MSYPFELHDLVARLRAKPAITTIEHARADLLKRSESAPVPSGVTVRETSIAGVPCELVTGDQVATRTIVYFHGGAYCMGSAQMYRHLAGHLARRMRAEVVVVDYRLAPEHPHPAALEDVWAVYRRVRADAAGEVVLAGDSAGGGLVLSTLLRLRDEGVPLPAAALLFSPWLDLQMTGSSYSVLAEEDPMVSVALLRQCAEAYRSSIDGRDIAALHPLKADLSRLPPVLVQVGTAEVLLSDAQRLRDAARRHRAPVTVDVWPGLFHAWQVFAGGLTEADDALQDAADWLDRLRAARVAPAVEDEVAHRLRDLEARSEIQSLAARYARAADSRDLDALVELFVPDIRVMPGDRSGRGALRDQFDMVLLRFGRSIHMIVGQVIDDIKGDRASGTTYCRAEHESGGRWVVATVMYTDRYERRDGAWLFRNRRMSLWYAADVLQRPPEVGYHDWPEMVDFTVGLPEAFPTWNDFWGHEQRADESMGSADRGATS